MCETNAPKPPARPWQPMNSTAAVWRCRVKSFLAQVPDQLVEKTVSWHSRMEAPKHQRPEEEAGSVIHADDPVSVWGCVVSHVRPTTALWYGRRTVE